MPKKPKMKSQDPFGGSADINSSELFSFDNVLGICVSKSGCSEEELMQGVTHFQSEKYRFQELTKEHLEKIRENYLITAFQIWSKYYHQSKNDDLIQLSDENIIHFKDSSGKAVKIKDFDKEEHLKILNRIRSKRDLGLKYREHLVKTYLMFASWLWLETFKPCPVSDPDRDRSRNRALDFESFINLLDKLDEKNRIVVKLLYFGGHRTLDEVINLDYSAINFQKNTITFGEEVIVYPAHVIEEITFLAGPKRKGHILYGRGTAPLNPSTIFRNFKEKGLDAGLGMNFTHKDLTTNRIENPN